MFFCRWKVEKMKWWFTATRRITFKQLWTLHQSLHHRLSRKSPLHHAVTAQWRSIFLCENVCLSPKISCENVHAQKQFILSNWNGGMKDRGKVYCYLKVEFKSKIKDLICRWNYWITITISEYFNISISKYSARQTNLICRLNIGSRDTNSICKSNIWSVRPLIGNR